MPPTIVFKDESFLAPRHGGWRWLYRRAVMTGFMVLSDVLMIFAAIEFALLLWMQVRADLVPAHYQSLLLPVSIIFGFIYFSLGLYPGVGLGSVEEERRMSIGTTLGMMGLMGLSFYLRNANEWSRAVLGLTYLFVLLGAPVARKVMRRIALQLDLWGLPVVVIGETEETERIYANLNRNWLHGLRPVLCIRVDSLHHIFPPASQKKKIKQWDTQGLFEGIDIAIIVPHQLPLNAVKNVLLHPSHHFQRVIVMLNEARMAPIWFAPLMLSEHLGLEVKCQLINPLHQAVKRMVDLGLILISLPVLIPIFLLFMIVIKLDSPGPIFYTQKRIGRDGRDILIWKFRTMMNNAESILEAMLEKDDALRGEWDQNFKLKNDPRITRVGKFLRRTSLDELPQLWNVLKREMSLIGPRPIVTEEIPIYGDDFEIFKQVVPGMTGMWQISGRNDLTYDERIGLDVYYVQNWSIWLDLHILMHTLLIVLQGRGAY
ncbi:MAG: undecaprenyl-phosphate galactose phosphotransferase WbaP [Chloroflexi bacterium]|nr:undecaprenyl-phosphate galactose phosphotransferase WbaP [Chloroflexota bacterium]